MCLQGGNNIFGPGSGRTTCFPKRPKTEPKAEPKAPAADESGLSIKKFLAQKGKELAAEDEAYVSDTKPGTVLQEYYRETVSEGSGQYDEAAYKKFGQMVKVPAAEVKWFEKEVGPLSDDFASTVYGAVLLDAMQAITGDPSVAAALYVAGKK